MKIKVSTLIVRYLERLGVSHIFGMPGAHVLPIYDTLYTSSITTILAKHEQGAAFMAGGVARASGRVAACIATAGPGATNLITGIANGWADHLPILAITGETSTHIFGKGGLQESSGEGGTINQAALFASITGYHRLIERTDYLAAVLNQATRTLLATTPAPVLLTLPYNLQLEEVDESILDQLIFNDDLPQTGIAEGRIDRLLEMLAAARSPFILAGHGIIRSQASDELQTLCEHLDIPVATSLKGKGAIAENHPLALGTLGVTSYGPAYQRLTEEADLLIILGASYNERTSYVWRSDLTRDKKLVRIDSDPAQLSRSVSADLTIAGDLRHILGHINHRLQATPARPHHHPATLPGADAPEFGRRFQLITELFHQLRRHLDQPVAIFDDNIIFAQNLMPILKGDRYYPNAGISALGHAIPAAIGARCQQPIATIAILGDGGFQMCCMELMTAINYQIPLTVILFNNATMGLIRKNQAQQYHNRYISCDFINPDYRQLAAALGFEHRLVRTSDDLATLWQGVDLVAGQTIIEVLLDKDTFPNYSSRR
jgi:acetolactate synthase I/II/III large subunit